VILGSIVCPSRTAMPGSSYCVAKIIPSPESGKSLGLPITWS
jgi:hypothetical protein